MTTSTTIATAIDHLDARELGAIIIWRDDAVGHEVYATREDVERLGQMLEDGTRDAYSLWCADTVIVDWMHVDRVEETHLGDSATGADLEPFAEAVVEALSAAGVEADYTVERDVDDEPCAVRITAHCDRDTYEPIAERVLESGW